MLGIVDARQLDEDAVRSFALDRRLFGAGLVDATADDLDRLIDRLAAPRICGDGAEPHRPRSVRGDVDRQVGIDLAQRGPRGIDAVGLAEREGYRVAFDIEPGIADISIAQCVAHVVDQRVEPLALCRGDIDLEEQIGATAQVETERNLLVRQPVRKLRENGRAEQVRQRQQHTERAYCANQRDFPIFKIQHMLILGSLCHSLVPTLARASVFCLAASRAAAGSGLASTLLIVLRRTRTRTPSAISTVTSSALSTRATVPMIPPPVTTRSPRRSASSIVLWAFALRCCGRIRRK